jgi:hypothetical protein
MSGSTYEVYDNVPDFTNAGVVDERELVTTFADEGKAVPGGDICESLAHPNS